mmetsp:Transcript_36193/g.84803  ORF Transcript_36193/g.84803 Transcript_36193/m.84803 type:complete len:201 (+) Transcript_36193:204-806(+)
MLEGRSNSGRSDQSASSPDRNQSSTSRGLQKVSLLLLWKPTLALVGVSAVGCPSLLGAPGLEGRGVHPSSSTSSRSDGKIKDPSDMKLCISRSSGNSGHPPPALSAERLERLLIKSLGGCVRLGVMPRFGGLLSFRGLGEAPAGADKGARGGGERLVLGGGRSWARSHSSHFFHLSLLAVIPSASPPSCGLPCRCASAPS